MIAARHLRRDPVIDALCEKVAALALGIRQAQRALEREPYTAKQAMTRKGLAVLEAELSLERALHVANLGRMLDVVDQVVADEGD